MYTMSSKCKCNTCTHLSSLKSLMKLFVSKASATFTAKSTGGASLISGEYSCTALHKRRELGVELERGGGLERRGRTRGELKGRRKEMGEDRMC